MNELFEAKAISWPLVPGGDSEKEQNKYVKKAPNNKNVPLKNNVL